MNERIVGNWSCIKYALNLKYVVLKINIYQKLKNSKLKNQFKLGITPLKIFLKFIVP